MAGTEAEREALTAQADAAWRDPVAVTALWEGAEDLDPRLLKARARGGFWDALGAAGVTLLVTREYEHLVLALSVVDGRPRTTYLRLPHPSGVAYDPKARRVHVASTRNPNVVVTLAPVTGALPRRDAAPVDAAGTLVPVTTRFFPGATYLHDLAMVGGRLHGNSVGQNVVVRFEDDGSARPVWWPRSVEGDDGPDVSRNYLQLNSIAAGRGLASSYFSASSEAIGRRRPGHRDYPVDGRGVIFSGRTREPVVRGLTRPHSARLVDERLWVDNSGYGEVGTGVDGRFEPLTKLPGWTRGLGSAGGLLWVATSRVIPRFRAYAPGLDVDRSICAIHAVDPASGKVAGSLVWPYGNQVFAVEPVPRETADALPFGAGRPSAERLRRLFYGFETG